MQGKQSLSRMGKKVSSFLSSSIFTLRLRKKCSHAAINVWSSNAATKTWISRVGMDVSGALTDIAAAWKTNLQASLKNFSAESWQSFSSKGEIQSARFYFSAVLGSIKSNESKLSNEDYASPAALFSLVSPPILTSIMPIPVSTQDDSLYSIWICNNLTQVWPSAHLEPVDGLSHWRTFTDIAMNQLLN